ncbi:MAG: TIGR03915 family putative DNA repair protein [Bacteroidota bacterium]|nr:TIGR03915 family putative DNA repair protein [Bacteroidota bacterium]
MSVYRYDKTFEGLLTAIFDAYNRKIFPDYLVAEGGQLPLFAEEVYTVYTGNEKSARVWKAIEKKVSTGACRMIQAVWLSEEPDSDQLLFRYIRKNIDSPVSIETNFGDEDVLAMMKLAKSVNQEAERIRQFVRFQKTADGIFFAPIAPKYNALPLAVDYFHSRFSDQEWVVYDTRRNYGYHYNLKTVDVFTFDENDPLSASGKLHPEQMAENEVLFQDFWKSYIKTMTIRERLNLKLQRQHMPVRFWKYLTEKQS